MFPSIPGKPHGTDTLLLLTLPQDSSDPSTLGHALLGFYESVAALPWEDSNLQIILPPDSLVYYFLFVCDIVMFSRMCGIFFRYRNALMKSMDAGRIYTTEFVGHFNGFVMDICNCIWRNRAFTPTDITINNAHACIIPE